MRTVRCDGCGIEIELDHPVLINFQMFATNTSEETVFDVCPDCWAKVVGLLARPDNEFGRLQDAMDEVVSERSDRTPS